MAYDFRTDSNWPSHPKFRKLTRLYGAEGVVAVFTLWGYVAEYRPSGILWELSGEEVLDACGVDVSRVEFLEALVKIRFLDVLDNGAYAVHGWAERQPHCVNREEYREKKRRAAHARWDAERVRNAPSPAQKTDPQPLKKKRKTSKKQDDAVSVAPSNARASASARAAPCRPDAIPSHPIPSHTLSHAHAREAERVREIFVGLLPETARNLAVDGWDQAFGRMIASGRSGDEVERVVRYAMGHGFWKRRVLSPKAFADNYTQLLIQMAQGNDSVGSTSGMSDDDWMNSRGKPQEVEQTSRPMPP